MYIIPICFYALKVTEGVLSGMDVLIGMDIISKGDFAVTTSLGETLFSFQIPSIYVIDFAKDSNKMSSPLYKENRLGRNEPCYCGSGKKYKHCCGAQ
jgi:hypothetical protein